MTADAAFTAAGSAAGYYYQARLALAEALRFAYSESGIEIAIERLDDVSFEKDGAPIELLQTKHHIEKFGDLTNTSVDLWKTLRVWSEAIKKDPSLPGRTRLVLVTTGSAPDGSAASLLRPALASAQHRDEQQAEALLIEAAKASMSSALKTAFEAFTDLAPEMRKALLGAIEVLDDAPVLADLDAEIEGRLKMIAPRGKTSAAREQLEGWWWPRICKALQQQPAGVISVLELEAKLDDIRDAMRRDSLPIEMEHVEPGDDELKALDEMTFVRQLRTVGLGSSRIEYAKRDYYRAFTQRSRWTRQHLLFDGEVSRFEKTLLEEWETRFHAMCDDLGQTTETATIRRAGRELSNPTSQAY